MPMLAADRPLPDKARPDRPVQDGGPDLRVRLAHDAESATIGAGEGHRLTASTGRRSRTLRPPVRVTVERGRVRLVDAAGGSSDWPRGREVLIASDRGGVVIDEALYPGDAVIVPKGESAFDVIERVPIEEYLPGVLSKELYAGWRDATYEAQAIAARSYALQERQRRRALGSAFDIESDTRDQAYGGSEAHAKARRAVAATRGVVLTYLDAPLRAYYSSTCGGRPASARDTWPIGQGFEFNLAGPIQATPRQCPCGFSPRYRWTVTRDAQTLAQRLAAFGADRGSDLRQLRALAAIEPARRNVAGRPAVYRVVDRDGRSWRLSAEDLRLALNFTGRGQGPPPTDARAWSGDVEVAVEGATVRIEGRGFGHGVGMCQFGAEGLARQGRTAAGILAHYYPGARLGPIR